jgi:hypothetical protein
VPWMSVTWQRSAPRERDRDMAGMGRLTGQPVWPSYVGRLLPGKLLVG